MNLISTLTAASRRLHAAAGKLSFLAPLATRLVIGLAFIHTGLGKWQHFERTVGYFASLGLPFPAFNAGLVATMELAGGAALMAGLFTRFFASGLAVTMVVALLTADLQAFVASWGSGGQTSPTDVTAFTFLLLLGWVVLHGPGAASLDRLLFGGDALEPR